MSFVHRTTVRFFQVDRAGILFFGRVFEMCHAAYEEALLASGNRIDAMIASDGVGMPLVHTEADFIAPMRLHDRLDVLPQVEGLSERSVTFGYRIVGSDDGKLRARTKLVHAFVDLKSFKATRAPQHWLRQWVDLGILDEAMLG